MVEAEMIDMNASSTAEAPVEAILRDELAHGDVMLGTIGPILGHLLANHDHSLFSDEIIARVRGMVLSVASQLLELQAEVAQDADARGFAERNAAELAELIARDPAFLLHCHGLAIESQLALRLQRRNAIDPTLSPLLQSLVASDDAETASLAMTALASQARFMQHQKRMFLPLTELPADLFHQALQCWYGFSDGLDEGLVGKIETAMRRNYDESASRLGLLSRLVEGMGNGHRAALSIAHAGVSLFLTALASGSQQDRDVVALSTNDRQLARLALALRAAGLNPKEVEEQFLYIHPEVSLPEGFSQLRVERAQAMLAASPGWRVS
ncbi:hypothetical protein [Erythrobacter litoralis]|uniref:DUF2336 domain-containing protein n=1 Tax=Erythrobacter litoralis (strain HTCC2594) TaxID=314225 RepID=Q2NA87_ERYLH|nr:hypothetical protein [Erythrobacter litoralis]ABC63404.1 hypothetical protein ELI_06560 [Erythrobacter litoralis HTCC2594]